jgi:hypothetical protein
MITISLIPGGRILNQMFVLVVVVVMFVGENEMAETTVIFRKMAIKTPDDRVWEFDALADEVTLFADETQYLADNPIGTLPANTFIEVGKKLQLLKADDA